MCTWPPAKKKNCDRFWGKVVWAWLISTHQQNVDERPQKSPRNATPRTLRNRPTRFHQKPPGSIGSIFTPSFEQVILFDPKEIHHLQGSTRFSRCCAPSPPEYPHCFGGLPSAADSRISSPGAPPASRWRPCSAKVHGWNVELFNGECVALQTRGIAIKIFDWWEQLW